MFYCYNTDIKLTLPTLILHYHGDGNLITYHFVNFAKFGIYVCTNIEHFW